jgi:uncharacterized membrane protein
MKLLEQYTPLGIFAGILSIAALLASFTTHASTLTWLSLMLALFLYCFLPGYTLLLHLEFDAVERIIFAFPTGVIVVSLLLYFLNLLGVGLTRLTVLAVILAGTVLSLLVLQHKKKQQLTSSAQ